MTQFYRKISSQKELVHGINRVKEKEETQMKERRKSIAMFLVPSIMGIFLFMVPFRHGQQGLFDPSGDMTIIVKVIADGFLNLVGYQNVAVICAVILTISAIMSIWGLKKPKFLTENEMLKECFVCAPIWVVIRIFGAVCVWITWLFGESFQGHKTSGKLLLMVAGSDQGELAFDLIIGLVFIFFIASYLLPLLTDFGLLEYVGALLTKYMRPLFGVPGRAAVDCITSWIGDGTLGVMLTNTQYLCGFYSAREAAIIATLFSAVSITFSLVVLSQVQLTHMFGVFYLLVCLVGMICALICPRIYPLRHKKNTYLVEGNRMSDSLPEGYTSSHQYGIDLAIKRVSNSGSIGEFLLSGTKNCVTMWFSILPTVMAIGTLALILANYTPIFNWLGLPFYPLLELLGVPDAYAAAGSMVVGFTDMFTPAILISGCEDPMTRFIVAVISITQVLFLDEVGGLILSSKIPVNLFELFVIFLERTIISILVVVPIAHLLF